MRTCGALALRSPAFLVTMRAWLTSPSRAPASKPPRRCAQPPRLCRSPDEWLKVSYTKCHFPARTRMVARSKIP
eukprot:6214619-Pleurochrysis_carterae.AAC.2